MTAANREEGRLRDLVVFLAANIVDEPEQVQVREIDNNDSVIFEVSVAPDDMGKIIGKHGRIARAIRTVTKAMAAREGKRAMVEIVG
ncbi:MAG: KH domain-containing protein [Clostridia bacterium]|nr:KH domain-containing protein [Clostridia bacterium]